MGTQGIHTLHGLFFFRMPCKRSDFGLGDDAQFHRNQSTIRYLAGLSGLGLGKTKHLAMKIGIIPLGLRGLLLLGGQVISGSLHTCILPVLGFSLDLEGTGNT